MRAHYLCAGCPVPGLSVTSLDHRPELAGGPRQVIQFEQLTPLPALPGPVGQFMQSLAPHFPDYRVLFYGHVAPR